MQVCIPGLHVSLGIFHKLFKLLQDACHQLDVRAADYSGNGVHHSLTAMGGDQYKKYVQAIQELDQKEEEACQQEEIVKNTEQLVTWMCLNETGNTQVIDKMRHQISESKKQVIALVGACFTFLACCMHAIIMIIIINTFACKAITDNLHIQRAQVSMMTPPKFQQHDGPCVRSLDEALKKINVQRQAYFGGTFVGNHVQKCLQVSYHTL